MDGTIAIFDVIRAKFLYNLEGHYMPVRSLVFFPSVLGFKVCAIIRRAFQVLRAWRWRRDKYMRGEACVESRNFLFMLLVYTCYCLLPEMLQGAFWIYETEPVELPTYWEIKRACVAIACWRPTWRPISIFKNSEYWDWYISLWYWDWYIALWYWDWYIVLWLIYHILLVTDIFCIEESCKLALYSPWQRL